MNLRFQKINPEAKAPEKSHDSDAGYDLSCLDDFDVYPFERALVKTGIKIQLAEGTYGRIAPRSGLAFKKGIDVMAGVVDAGYTGELGVVLVNLSDEVVNFKKHDRIAQLIVEKCYNVYWHEVEDLDSTERGDGGFGSTDSNPNNLSEPRPVFLPDKT
tara:strand:- start:3885 stop:4358 length:474 start_codon:yes stop_codon:yes gene_type:complete